MQKKPTRRRGRKASASPKAGRSTTPATAPPEAKGRKARFNPPRLVHGHPAPREGRRF